ncbi:MAG: hypothetical protein CVU41_18660 [Chloroflexi bacterium HGW-Chloroflexi-3]|nr:MAG: hypothetical protein CVU41_18660 [Chloroflexi bacterium HGW-Chloroflexi-3]
MQDKFLWLRMVSNRATADEILTLAIVQKNLKYGDNWWICLRTPTLKIFCLNLKLNRKYFLFIVQ